MLKSMTPEEMKAELEKMELGSYLAFGHGEPPAIVLDLTHFSADPFYKRTLLRLRGSCGTNHLYEMVTWNKYGIEAHSQEEGCFHAKLAAGPYNISWQEIEDAAKAKKDYEKTQFGRTHVRIPKESLDKILQLREMSYENAEDAQKINELLRSGVQNNSTSAK